MSATTTTVRTKPLMNMKQILLMNLGFFGIQFSFGLQQTAVTPIYSFLGANPHDLPLLNLAGPITGLLVQPIIGAWSDRTWSERWGRRKAFFLVGAIGCSICLFFFPSPAIIMASAIVLGIGLFIPTAAITTLLMELPGVTPRHVTLMMGTMFSFCYIVSAFAPSFVAYMRERTGSFVPGFIGLTVLSWVIFISGLLLPETGPGAKARNLTQKPPSP